MSRLRVATEADAEKVTTQTATERAKARRNTIATVGLVAILVEAFALEALGIAALVKVLRS